MKQVLRSLLMLLSVAASSASAAEYVVIISRATRADPAWAKVAQALVTKNNAHLLEHEGGVERAAGELRKLQPRFVCFVARPEELDRVYVLKVHRFSRAMDDDSYGDFLWGIITGYEAADALRIAEAREPLIIHTGLHTTGTDHRYFDCNVIFSDGTRGVVSSKGADGRVSEQKNEESAEGLAGAFARAWEEVSPDLLVTSAHATQYNLEIPFTQGLIASFRNRFHVLRRDQIPGFARFLNGAVFVGNEAELEQYIDSTNAPVMAPSTNPKVWIGAGNCLLGNVSRSRNTMAVTALSSMGTMQLVGYTVTTWYGKGGWGTLGTFFGSHGRLTLSESFFLNNQKILEETKRRYPGLMAVNFDLPDIQAIQRDRPFADALQKSGERIDKDALGLVHDRDVVAFYGDPKWEARLDAGRVPAPFSAEWKAVPRGLELKLTATAEGGWKGDFEAILPTRIVRPLVSGADGLDVIANDEFILLRGVNLARGQTRSVLIRTSD